ncbi:MAG: TRAP transporter small permease subunit [Deltaproteobacteria bacterium]|nr:TRAP transporter small permease subunit [Deltaproteobacteria bacterium]
MTTSRADAGGGRHGTADALYRALALSLAALTFVFLFNNYLDFWQGWPGPARVFGVGTEAPLGGAVIFQAWLQLASYVLTVAVIFVLALRTRERAFASDAALLKAVTTYIIATAFWATFLIGIVDGVISFLRVEGLLPAVLGETLGQKLGVPSFRGTYVHIPLILAGAAVACFKRGLDFIWLSLLVVVAEFQIVIARFIFSYEQAFMGDLVRFWYAALFLFASAHTLVAGGHVRVDVLFTHFSEKRKALVNAWGSMVLGVPLCWTILGVGMSGQASVINSPLLYFETSQSGFGLYVKYLMAGFLAVYAVSMMTQFLAYFLDAMAVLRGQAANHPTPEPS